MNLFMQNPTDITIQSYNTTAPEYAKNTQGIILKKELYRFCRHLPENSLILDIGCGPGRDAKIFGAKGYRVIGIDLSSKLLDMARQKVASADFRLMNISNINFPSDHFEGLWANASLMHLSKERIQDALKQYYDTLKEHGLFYITLKQGEGEQMLPDKRYGNVMKKWSFYQQEEIESILQDTGFKILENYVLTYNKGYATTNPWMNIFVTK